MKQVRVPELEMLDLARVDEAERIRLERRRDQRQLNHRRLVESELSRRDKYAEVDGDRFVSQGRCPCGGKHYAIVAYRNGKALGEPLCPKLVWLRRFRVAMAKRNWRDFIRTDPMAEFIAQWSCSG